MRNSVVIDTASGQALIGDTLVPVREAGSHGELQVGGPAGPVLRPLTFGERTRVVTRAAGSPAALDILCAGVLQAALLQPGEADRLVQEIVALAMAGADQDAPPFAETVLRVARTAGWELRQLYDAEAAEVDRLAVYLGGRPPDSGWTQILFAGNAVSLASVRQELAEQLLRRADPFAETGEETQTFPLATAPALHESVPSFLAQDARSFSRPTSPTEHQPTNAERVTILQEPIQQTQPVASSPRSGLTASDNHADSNTLHLRVPRRIFEQRTGTRSAVTRSGGSNPPRLRFSLTANTNSKQANPPSVATTSAAQAVASQVASAPLPVQPPPLQLLRTTTAARPAPHVTLSSAEENLRSTPVQHARQDALVPSHVGLVTAGDQELAALDWTEMADALAELLDQEADMRGLKR